MTGNISAAGITPIIAFNSGGANMSITGNITASSFSVYAPSNTTFPTGVQETGPITAAVYG